MTHNEFILYLQHFISCFDYLAFHKDKSTT